MLFENTISTSRYARSFGTTKMHLEIFHTLSDVNDDGTNDCNSVHQYLYFINFVRRMIHAYNRYNIKQKLTVVLTIKLFLFILRGILLSSDEIF